jgi:chromosome partitioning protein
MPVVALCGIKGGVGKSTAAMNLAVLAAIGGERTLLWDLDMQGACAYGLGVVDAEPLRPKRLLKGDLRLEDCVVDTGLTGLELVPAGLGHRRLDVILHGKRSARRLFRAALAESRAAYRWIFLDCPPGLTTLTECVLAAADIALVPVVPAPLSARAFEELAVFVEQRELDSALLVPFFSMAEERRGTHLQLMRSFREREPGTCRAVIPRRADVERSAARRRPIVLARPASPAAAAFAGLWEEVAALSRQRQGT